MNYSKVPTPQYPPEVATRRDTKTISVVTDGCSTPLVANVGLVPDYLDPAAGFSLIRGVSLGSSVRKNSGMCIAGTAH